MAPLSCRASTTESVHWLELAAPWRFVFRCSPVGFPAPALEGGGWAGLEPRGWC
jgi:hypothetical protein